MSESSYDKKYYDSITRGSSQSAREVIPLVFDLFKPESVVDVGCGTGSWLQVCLENGVADILGIDGSHVPVESLLFSPENFITADLQKPFVQERKFGMIISLEVAEHISPEKAGIFVDTLCGFGDVILFSAAVPGQGGLNHVNEQFPEYWENLFHARGFTAFDSIREQIWMNSRIDNCYRQNMMFFVRDSVKEKYIGITRPARRVLPLVHPEIFEEKIFILESYKKALRSPLHSSWFFLKSFFRFFYRKKK